MVDDEDRQRHLRDLIAFRGSIEDLIQTVAGLPWDAERELVALTKGDLVKVLGRYASGELSAEQVEAWANLIEGREDIEMDSEGRGPIAQAIQVLANPLLEGPLNERHEAVLVSLSD